MQLRRALSLPILLLFLTISFGTHAHNVTRLLAKYPEFSTFNHYLTVTHLAAEINTRTTITVCAVDNAAMNDLLSNHLSIYSIKNILSLHVLLDYFGTKKLHQITNGTALAATMYQAAGSAPGSSGFVNITDLKGGKVGFGPEDNGGNLDSFFVKSVEEVPYNISVIQISKFLPSKVAEAPSPSPTTINLTALMSAHGCKIFADTLLASDAEKTFEENANGGLTVFCTGDEAFKAVFPKYKNLTAAGKTSLLEFHGVPVYMSMPMLKSNNGVMNTLATDGANKFDFTVQNDDEEVTLKTKLVTAKIIGTLFDEQPLAIYTIDKVLKPKELFKGDAETPAPAPAPEKTADSPKSHKVVSTPASDSPAESPDDEEPADQKANDNSAVNFSGGTFGFVALSAWIGHLLL